VEVKTEAGSGDITNCPEYDVEKYWLHHEQTRALVNLLSNVIIDICYLADKTAR